MNVEHPTSNAEYREQSLRPSSLRALLESQFAAASNSPLPLAYVLSAKGAALISKPGTASQGSGVPNPPALKARFTFGASSMHDCPHVPHHSGWSMGTAFNSIEVLESQLEAGKN